MLIVKLNIEKVEELHHRDAGVFFFCVAGNMAGEV
jgi:hypothetical protein